MTLEWGEIFSASSGNPFSAESQPSLSRHYYLQSYEGIKGLKAHITMQGNANPIIVKARRVPYALKEQVGKELEKLEKYGVIKETDKSS